MTSSRFFQQKPPLKHSNSFSPFPQGLTSKSSHPPHQANVMPGILLPKSRQTQSKPCQLFGLDPKKLQIESLLKHRGYRRLYNIVANDQTNPNHIFRPNLIRELYFLLQITPFIQESLQNDFLNKTQEWYNSNDHKKIKLSKNLDGFVKNVLHKREGSEQSSATASKQNKENTQPIDDHAFTNTNKSRLINGKRPKSSVQWDTSLNPFLRPYTAKLRSSKNGSQYLNTNKGRPESSKFGGLASTNANTCMEDRTTIHRNNGKTYLDEEEDNILNIDVNMDEEQQERMCEIEQEWKRSQDFRNKRRTLHPEEEPTYQKLMSLISKVKTPSLDNCDNVNTSTSRFANTFQRSAGSTIMGSTSLSNKRSIQSAAATINRSANNARLLAEKELKEHRINNEGDTADKNENKLENNQNDSAQQDNFGRPDEEDNNEDNVSEQNNNINLDTGSGKYRSDKRSRQGRRLRNKNNGNHIYATLNGVKILRPYTAQESNIICKLDQYSTLEHNKKVIQANEDPECIQRYQEYVRKKTMIKREISRKSEAKRYMENFKNVVKVVPNRVSPHKAHSVVSPCNPVAECTQKVFDFSVSNQCQGELDSSLKKQPTYNVHDYFENKKKKTISASCRGLHRLDIEPHLQDQKTVNKMTHQKRLFSEQKFDPLNKINLDNYNREALQEIQRIKERFGGKITASTDALIKALYVDAPLPVFDKQNQPDGASSLKFQLPDKGYLMIQKQEKKKKKRKLKKRTAKSLSKSRR